MSLDLNLIESAVESFEKQRIAVLGDLMLDKFVSGAVDRISPEAPVPVLLKERQEYFAGGAANVAINVAELGGHAVTIGVVGDDDEAFELKRRLKHDRIDISGVHEYSMTVTTLKTRFVAMGQQLLRVDDERHLTDFQPSFSLPVDKLDGCTALLVSDYNKGVIPLWARDFIRAAAERGIPVIVDPKPPNWKYYGGCDVVTPNRKESMSLAPEPPADPRVIIDIRRRAVMRAKTEIEDVARAVCREAGAKNAVLTWGAEGMYAWDGENIETIPSHRVQVFDSTGAGDSVIAALTLAIAAGLTLGDAARVANAAGAVAVSRPWIARVSRDDVLRVLGAVR